MHRHFRMIAISEHLRNHGYDPTMEPHTRIPGIWQKLDTLYNMRVIDDRENSFEFEDPEKFLEFELPKDLYGERKYTEYKVFERCKRIKVRGKESHASEGNINEDQSSGTSPMGSPRNSSDPPSANTTRLKPLAVPQPAYQTAKKRRRAETTTAKTRASTVDDTDEAKTSPAQSPTPRTARAGRSNRRSMGKIQAQSGSRQQSTTADEDEGREETADAEDDEQEAEESEATSTTKTSKTAVPKPRDRRIHKAKPRRKR